MNVTEPIVCGFEKVTTSDRSSVIERSANPRSALCKFLVNLFKISYFINNMELFLNEKQIL